MKLSEAAKTKTWIVGVSGGGDSMALLHMCLCEGMHIIAAHMNYQKRATANRDTKGVQTFCQKHQIPLEIRYQNEPCKGNFQAFARTKRYAFYRELIQRYHAEGVLVAHQLDDHLETYLMQMEKGIVPMVYGIGEKAISEGCHVVRPLLSYTKKQLENYCHMHDVPFWLDESNLTDAYTRNRIRHEIVDHMSDYEKHELAKEIAEKNKEHQLFQRQAQAFIAQWQYDCASLFTLKPHLQSYVLHQWIYDTCHCLISKKEEETLRHMLAQPNNWIRPCGQAYEIHKDYQQLSIVSHTKDAYSYQFETLESMNIQTPYFSFCDHGKTIEGVTLSKNDFPIVIRAYQKGDVITLRFGKKKLSRWFIDRKIPKEEREMWPVMVNREGNIVFVPKIGCDIAHFSNNPSIFVLK